MNFNSADKESSHVFPAAQHANLPKLNWTACHVSQPVGSCWTSEETYRQINKPPSAPRPGPNRLVWNAALIDVGIYVCHAIISAWSLETFPSRPTTWCTVHASGSENIVTYTSKKIHILNCYSSLSWLEQVPSNSIKDKLKETEKEI